MVVSDYGGERSDAGSLGTGIYFGLDASTSVKYSTPGQTRGSRFLLICDVALGSVKVMSLLYLLFAPRIRLDHHLVEIREKQLYIRVQTTSVYFSNMRTEGVEQTLLV